MQSHKKINKTTPLFCLLLLTFLLPLQPLMSQAGTFTASGQSLVSSQTFDGAAGDVDGDGDLDLVDGNSSGDIIWLNDGSGVFTNSGQSLGNTWANGLGLADLDGDGDLDILTSRGFGTVGPAQLYLNNGSGVYSGPTNLPASGSGNSLSLGDLDGDGDIDAVTAGSPHFIWINGGSANFTTGQTLTGANNSGVALGDFDGDGDLDIFLSQSGSSNGEAVWFNNGNATFTPSSQTFIDNGGGNDHLEVGDVDGDGDLDVFGSGTVGYLYINNGSGTFSDPTTGIPGITRGSLGDLDGDGDLDLFVKNLSSQNNQIFFNDGSGNFTNSGQSIAGGTIGSRPPTLGDFDGDGDLDAFSHGNGTGTILFNQTPPVLVPTLSEWGLILLALVMITLGTIVVWKKKYSIRMQSMT